MPWNWQALYFRDVPETTDEHGPRDRQAPTSKHARGRQPKPRRKGRR